MESPEHVSILNRVPGLVDLLVSLKQVLWFSWRLFSIVWTAEAGVDCGMGVECFVNGIMTTEKSAWMYAFLFVTILFVLIILTVLYV